MTQKCYDSLENNNVPHNGFFYQSQDRMHLYYSQEWALSAPDLGDNTKAALPQVIAWD